jgi:acyl-CoA synthetase (AMP-forming)/AMP-acid ligase II
MYAAANITQATSLIAILIDRASAQPDHPAYHFIGDGPDTDVELGYRQLLKEALSLAASLHIMQLPGQPVLLACKSNFLFIIGLYACVLSGALAVPTAPPRRPALEDRIGFLARHSGAAAVLTDSDAMLGMDMDLPMIDIRQGRPSVADPLHRWTAAWPDADQPALIQYTSGTSGNPHGVIHSQRSLMAASNAVGMSFGHDDARSAILLTLPLFHETGLMLGVIHPLAAGIPVTLMTPAQFVQRPERWLRLIQERRITTAGGPNFMFDMVTRAVDGSDLPLLDLSSLRACFCTGEPVRAGTIAHLLELLLPFRFRPEALLPCYSLSETGRHVTGGISGRAPGESLTGLAGLVHPLVSCGKPHIDCRLLVVNPASRCVVASGEVGEIWLQCASAGLGYWNEPLLTKTMFNARLQDGGGLYLRTGDLAVLRNGELYVLGRLAERIRIDGADHAPHEIELQVERSHIGLRPSCAAAFTVERAGHVRLVVVCELKRDLLRCREKWPHIECAIRSAIRRVHGLTVDDVVLLEPGTLPKTSSGKVRRSQCRDDYLAGALIAAIAIPAEDDRSSELARLNKH